MGNSIISIKRGKGHADATYMLSKVTPTTYRVDSLGTNTRDEYYNVTQEQALALFDEVLAGTSPTFPYALAEYNRAIVRLTTEIGIFKAAHQAYIATLDPEQASQVSAQVDGQIAILNDNLSNIQANDVEYDDDQY